MPKKATAPSDSQRDNQEIKRHRWYEYPPQNNVHYDGTSDRYQKGKSTPWRYCECELGEDHLNKRDSQEWIKEFDEKMCHYTDGNSEFGIAPYKGTRVKGFWVRSGMDGEIDSDSVKDFIQQEKDKAHQAGFQEAVEEVEKEIRIIANRKNIKVGTSIFGYHYAVCSFLSSLKPMQKPSNLPKPTQTQGSEGEQ